MRQLGLMLSTIDRYECAEINVGTLTNDLEFLLEA